MTEEYALQPLNTFIISPHKPEMEDLRFIYPKWNPRIYLGPNYNISEKAECYEFVYEIYGQFSKDMYIYVFKEINIR